MPPERDEDQVNQEAALFNEVAQSFDAVPEAKAAGMPLDQMRQALLADGVVADYLDRHPEELEARFNENRKIVEDNFQDDLAMLERKGYIVKNISPEDIKKYADELRRIYLPDGSVPPAAKGVEQPQAESTVQNNSELSQAELERRRIVESNVHTGAAVWRTAAGDNPVAVTGISGWGTDGRLYITIEGSPTGIPFDEVVYDAAPVPEAAPIQDAPTVVEAPPAAEQPAPAIRRGQWREKFASLLEMLHVGRKKQPAGEAEATPAAEAAAEGRPERRNAKSGKVIEKLAIDVGWRTVGTVFGVKSIGDAALFFAKRGDIYEATRGKQVQAERAAAEKSVKDFLREYHAGDKKAIHDTAKALTEQIREAKYLSPEDRKEYRTQVANIIKKYHKSGINLEQQRDLRIGKAAELYFQKKVSTARVVGDAMNTMFTLGGMPMLRGVGVAAGAAAERWHKSGVAFEREELKAATAKEKAGAAPPATARSKRGHQAVDLVFKSTWETMRAATGFKKSAESQHRFRDALEAWGSLTRLTALTGVAASELGDHGVREAFGKLMEAYKQNGGSQVLENLSVNFDRTIDGYRMLLTHPSEVPARIWHGITRSFEHGSVPPQPGAAKVPEVGGGSNKVTIPETRGSGMTQKEVLDEAQEFDRLTKKLGLSANEVAKLTGPVSLKQGVDYLHKLEQAVVTSKGQGAAITPDEVRIAAQQHPELIKDVDTKPSSSEAPHHTEIDTKNLTVRTGEGIENKGIQQILAEPKKFGFAGDAANQAEVRAFANRLAHEAALNTKFGEGAVVGKDTAGHVYDVRLKASAIGEQVQLQKGADGKWHYEFGKNLDVADTYKHVAEPTVRGSVTSGSAWVEGRPGAQGSTFYHEVTPTELPQGASATSHHIAEVLVDYAPKGQSMDGVADYVELRDADGHRLEVLAITDHSTPEAAVAEAHNLALDFDKAVTQVEHTMQASAGDLSLAEKAAAVRWASGAHETSLEPLNEGALSRLTKVDSTVAELKGHGFSRVDLSLAEQYRDGKLGWHISDGGKFVWDESSSPLTGKAMELPLARGSSFTPQAMDDLKAVANTYLSEEEQVFAHVHQAAGGDTEKILSLKCSEANDEALTDITRSKLLFIPLSKGGGPELYQYFKRTLGDDYLADTQHTIGERLAMAAHRGTDVQLPTSGGSAAGYSEVNAVQYHELRSAPDMPGEQGDNLGVGNASSGEIVPSHEVTSATVRTPDGSLSPDQPHSSPQVVAEVRGEVNEAVAATAHGTVGASEHAGSALNELDSSIAAYDALHNPSMSAADKMAALHGLKLTDGGRPYMFKSGTEGIGLKDGKYLYYDRGTVHELTPDNINAVAGSAPVEVVATEVTPKGMLQNVIENRLTTAGAVEGLAKVQGDVPSDVVEQALKQVSRDLELGDAASYLRDLSGKNPARAELLRTVLDTVDSSRLDAHEQEVLASLKAALSGK